MVANKSPPKDEAPTKDKDPEEEEDNKNKELEQEEEEEELPSIENIPRKQFAKDKTLIFKDLPSGLLIPKYFANPSTDSSILKIERNEAEEFVIGPINVGTAKKSQWGSISAKLTYVGPRRFVSRQIGVGSMSTSPSKNFWKIWNQGVRLFKGQEFAGLIKDVDFIQEAFKTKNYQIRFIVDKHFTQGKAEARLKKQNDTQWLGHPYRLREAAIRLGQEVPLKRGEAATILGKLKTKDIALADKKFNYILDYLQKMKKEDETPPLEETEK